MMKISIGADHRGYALKQELIARLPEYQWTDVGAHSLERSDYPVFAAAVCNNVLEGKAERGVLLCGSGVGMSIAANRYVGIYAALCWTEQGARMASEDDGANILVLPADEITIDRAVCLVQAWLAGIFKAGRYEERLLLLEKLASRK
jgi:RpiB/LacA/LacB family sugar-phosphate isomerase